MTKIETVEEVADMLVADFGLDVQVTEDKIVGEYGGHDVIVVEWDERGEFKITATVQGEVVVWEQDVDDEDEDVHMWTHAMMQDADRR